MTMIGLTDGQIEMYGFSDESARSLFFEPTEKGAQKFLEALPDDGAHVQFSSSVNHPDEYGFDDDFDVDKWIASGHNAWRYGLAILEGFIGHFGESGV